MDQFKELLLAIGIKLSNDFKYHCQHEYYFEKIDENND